VFVIARPEYAVAECIGMISGLAGSMVFTISASLSPSPVGRTRPSMPVPTPIDSSKRTRPLVIPVKRRVAVRSPIIAGIGPIVPVTRPIVALTGPISTVVGQIIAVIGRTTVVIRPLVFTVAISGIAAAVPAIAAVVDLDKVAVACGIDLHRRSLLHGLACGWHSEDDAAQNSGGDGQCFEVDHGKVPPL